MNNIQKKTIIEFQKKIFLWWENNKRDLPWRKTTDPYHIMVSEIMLQQTQVSRVESKYLEFLEHFPTMDSLAKADIADVIKTWSGLGYNRRAIWLQEAIKEIVKKAEFPKNPEELQKLKGIGPYTSNSILIFAFNENIATIDTNIRRIFIHEGFATENTTIKELQEIARKIMPDKKSREWHSALMDYGALVLTSRKTNIRPVKNQTKYSRSSRFFRGLILKHLISEKKMSKSDLLKMIEVSPNEIEEILRGLIKDGLIKKEKNNYTLPSNK